MKKKVTSKYKWNTISTSYLKEGSILITDKGLVLEFIGQVDIRTNQEYLFKTRFSPFATAKWIELTPKKIGKLKITSFIS